MTTPFILLALGSITTMPPVVGDKAPTFSLLSLDKKVVRLAPLLRKGPVVLVVLRGYPGYQCPFCTKQVGELVAKDADFAKTKTDVVMVYPGPADGLAGHATEFVSGMSLPKRFHLTLDPDYSFTNRYGLRWNAPQETAYPSTYVVGRDGRIVYARTSHSHGDRAPVAEVLHALAGLGKK